MKVTQVEIRKECRELHGVDKAFDEAVKYLRDYYTLILKSDCNKEASIIFEVHIDRFKKLKK